MERTCTKCFLQKPFEEFGWKERPRNKRHAVCKTCTAKRSSAWYYENQDRQKENVKLNNQQYRQNARDYIWEYLSAHPCTQCGDTDPVALEFHHVRGEKTIEVSKLIGRGASLEVIKAEIEKCDVLCASCHRKLTAKELGWYRGRW